MSDEIYRNTVDDGNYEVLVTGNDHGMEHHRTGTLTVTRIETSGCREKRTVLHKEEVPLMFGAIFGPDVSDVAAWQAKPLK